MADSVIYFESFSGYTRCKTPVDHVFLACCQLLGMALVSSYRSIILKAIDNYSPLEHIFTIFIFKGSLGVYCLFFFFCSIHVTIDTCASKECNIYAGPSSGIVHSVENRI